MPASNISCWGEGQSAWVRGGIEEALAFFHEHLSDSKTEKHSFKAGLPLAIGLGSNNDYLEWITDLLRLYRIQPQKLIFHLHQSEGMLSAEVLDVIRALTDLGSTVCADAFLADGPSFEILSNPNIHYVSCESAVVKAALDSDLIWRYLSGLVSLSKTLDKTVMLDGVDTERELDGLSNLSPVWCQGRTSGGILSASEVGSYLKCFQSPE